MVGTCGLSQGQGLWDPGQGLRPREAEPLGGHRKPRSLLEPRGSFANTRGKEKGGTSDAGIIVIGCNCC